MQMPKSLSFGGSALQDVRDETPAAIGEVINHNNAILEGMYRLLYNDINLSKIAARQVGDGVIGAVALADGSVTTAKIDVAAIIAAKIAENAVEEAHIIAEAITAGKTSLAAINSSTGAVNATHIVAAMIATNAVTEAKIIANAVTESKVLADAITAAKINVSGLDGTSGDVAANHIVAGMIQTDAITSVKILADAVTTAKINVAGLDGTSGRIVVADATDANAVTGGINTYAATLIQPGKILISGATNLDDWSHGSDATKIDGGDIYTQSVTATQILANTITAAEIAANAVTASELNVVGIDGATGRIVVADAIDANVVTAGINTYAATLIQPGKILISGGTNLDNWSHGDDATKIDGGDIYAQSITVAKILANTITTDKLNITNIGTITNQLGNLLAGTLTGTTVTGGILQTAASGKRVRIDEAGIRLYYGGGTVGLYGTTGNGGSNITYGTTGNGGDNALYGAGILATINHPDEKVPFRVETEQIYADFHYFNRGSTPSGAATAGDKCVVGGLDYTCTVAGTPGTWQKTGLQS